MYERFYLSYNNSSSLVDFTEGEASYLNEKTKYFEIFFSSVCVIKIYSLFVCRHISTTKERAKKILNFLLKINKNLI